MADVEQAIYSILTNDATVAALTSTRVRPAQLLQDETMPAIRYERVSATRTHAMNSDPGLVAARFQVDNFAASYSGARALANATRGALSRYRGTAASVTIQATYLDNEQGGFEVGVEQYVITQDYMIHYVE